MQEKYWEERYKNNKLPTEPSEFAKFCGSFLREKRSIIDLGCGNGRDSYYFGEIGHQVFGVDQAIKNEENENVNFDKISIDGLMSFDCHFDVVYSRFFLHSIFDEQILNIIKWSKRWFVAEFRSDGDKPVEYTDHSRNYIDGNWILQELINNGYKILYFRKGRGMAEYKSEDPLVIRVIAIKK